MADGRQPVPAGLAKPTLDLATVVGLGGGLLLIASAIAWGGSVTAFLDVPAVLIVIGGTLAVTTICFTLPEIGRTATVIGKTVMHTARDPRETAFRLIKLSESSRRNGLLSLQNVMGAVRAEPLLHKGLSLIVDGTPGEDAEKILRQDSHATMNRHLNAAGVLRKAAEVSPAMGLIGTLIGLVQMLGNLDDPSTIGPSMAVALLTTFYGAILANMVFSPLAAKLERNSGEEALVNQLYILAVVSMSRQENPRRLEMLLNSLLPPARRVRYFD